MTSTRMSLENQALNELKNAVQSLRRAEAIVAESVIFSNANGDRATFQNSTHLKGVIRNSLDDIREYADFVTRQCKAGSVKPHDKAVQELAATLRTTFSL